MKFADKPTKSKWYLWSIGIVAAACVLAALVLVSTVVGSFRYVRVGPEVDYWGAAMPFLQAAVEGPWSWSLLWQISSGAHCLALPRLIFLSEWYVDDFRNIGTLCISWLLLLGSAGIVLRAVWAESELDWLSRVLCVFLVVMGFGSAQHMNNLAYSFNIQWPLDLFLSLLFIYLLVANRIFQATFEKFLCRVVTIVLVAVLLSISGFTLPALFVCLATILVGLKNQRIHSVLILICAAVVTIAYILFLPFVQNMLHQLLGKSSDISNNIKVTDIFFSVLQFSFLYLVSPISEMSRQLGLLLSIVILLFCCLQFIYRRRGNDRSILFWLVMGYAAFAVGMAVSTAIGRGIMPDLAFNPRYRTIAVPYLALVAILLVCCMQKWNATARVLCSLMLIVITMLTVIPGHIRLLKQFSGEYDQYSIPVISIAVGLEPRAKRQINISAFGEVDWDLISRARAFLRQHRRGIYATPLFTQLGERVKLPNQQSVGSTRELRALPGGGYKWQGYTDQCGSDGRVAVVNADGKIIGSGAVSRKIASDGWRVIYDGLLPLCRAGHPVLWTAYLPATVSAGDTVSAVSFPRDNEPVVIVSNERIL
jgi:hypothetical protein